MERDLKNLQKGMNNIEKEKSQLKDKLESEYKSNENIYYQQRRNESKEMLRSQDDFSQYNKRRSSNQNSKMNSNTFFARKRSQMSKHDNPCLSSTNSLKSFNLLQTNKSLIRKSVNNFGGNIWDSEQNESVIKGKHSSYPAGDVNLSTTHKTCSRRGICSVNGHVHKPSVPRQGKKNANNTSMNFDDQSVNQKVKNMCQLMIDSATRLEWAKCLDLYIPTEFLDHISGDEPCKGSIWNKSTRVIIKDQMSETASPVINKESTFKLNKQNKPQVLDKVGEELHTTSTFLICV